MTRAELRTRVEAACGAPGYYTTAKVHHALDQGQRIFAFLTLCLEGTATIPVLAGQGWVTPTPTNWIVPLRCDFDGAKLQVETFASLAALNPYWQNTQDDPLHYVPAGPQLIAVHPRPLADGTLTVQYARLPAAMATDASTPEIREVYHECLIDYAIPRLRVKEGGQELTQELPRLVRFFDAARQEAVITKSRGLSLRYDVLATEDWWVAMEGSWLTSAASSRRP